MTTIYQNYPKRIVMMTGVFSLLVYGAGLFIMQSAGWIYAGVYLGYILVLEIRLLKYHCPTVFIMGNYVLLAKGSCISTCHR